MSWRSSYESPVLAKRGVLNRHRVFKHLGAFQACRSKIGLRLWVEGLGFSVQGLALGFRGVRVRGLGV